MHNPHLLETATAYYCVCVCLVAQLCLTLRPHGLQPTRLLCPWNSPGKNTEVGSHSLLKGNFQTPGLNPGLPHYRQILYRLRYQGSYSKQIFYLHTYVHVTHL